MEHSRRAGILLDLSKREHDMRKVLLVSLAVAAGSVLAINSADAQGRGNAPGQMVRQQTPGHLMQLDPTWRETVRERRGASRFAPGHVMRQDPYWRETVRSRRGASMYAPGYAISRKGKTAKSLRFR